MSRWIATLMVPTIIIALLLLPDSNASALRRKNSLRVRRARLGQGRLPPLLLSLPSQVQEVSVAPASLDYLSPAPSEQVASNYLSPLASDPPADFLLPLTTNAPGDYLAPQPSDPLPAVSGYLGPANDPVGYPATQSVDITYLPPQDDVPGYGEEEDDSPNEPTNPSRCTLVDETVVDLVEETQCRQMVRCRELVQCKVTRETVCSNVEEEEEEEVCDPVDGPEQCEDVERTVIETECQVLLLPRVFNNYNNVSL